MPDWEARILNRLSMVPDLPLHAGMAEQGLKILGRMRVPDMVGMPRMRDVMADWLTDIARAIFGSYDPETKRRMLREVFLLVPKKNSKSSAGGAIMLTLMILNERPNAEFVIVAPTIKISHISFSQIANTIAADPGLEALFGVAGHIRRITHKTTGATLVILAADTDVVTGGKQAYVLLDETHVFAAKSNAAGILTELRGGLAARPDGLFIQITTQSKVPPAGVFKQELTTARAIRDGTLKLPRLAVLYELPEAEVERWDEPENLARVNPNLGRSVDLEYLMDGLATAREKGIGELMLFASQHANKEVGLSLRSDRWAGADEWLAAEEPELAADSVPRLQGVALALQRAGRAMDRRRPLERLMDMSEVCVAGIDGGGLDDLMSLAVIGRERDTRRWLHWSHTWAHPKVLERRKEVAPALLGFAEDGDLTISDTVGSDVTDLVDVLAEVHGRQLLAQVGMDPMGVGMVVDALAERDIAGGDIVVGVQQGWTLTGAIKTAERKLVDGTLKHSGQKIMAWAVGNAKVEPRGNAIIITKQAAGSAKIDPLMAMFNAVTLMSRNPESPMSGYESQPVRFL